MESPSMTRCPEQPFARVEPFARIEPLIALRLRRARDGVQCRAGHCGPTAAGQRLPVECERLRDRTGLASTNECIPNPLGSRRRGMVEITPAGQLVFRPQTQFLGR